MKALAIALLLSSPIFAASNWPQFRGPNATGIGDGKPPQTFSKTNNVLWQIDLPYSPSSPCIWNDHIFVTTYDDNKLQLRDYRRKDGENNWARGISLPTLEDFHATEGSPAASTPATDGRVVVAYFGSCGLFAYDFQGKELWRQPMPTAQTAGGFGTGTSPIIVGKRVILNRDEQGNSAILAFDIDTGKKLWRTPRIDSITSYSTPVLWKNEIVVAGSIAMKAYDLEKGTEKWTVRGLPSAACPSPVATDDLLFFAGWSPGKSDSPFPTWAATAEQMDKNKDGKISPEEYGDPSWFKPMDADKDGFITKKDWDELLSLLSKGNNTLIAIKPGGHGDISETHIAWRYDRGLPYVPSSLVYKDRLYMIKDGGMVSCFEAKTGKPIYTQERIEARGSYYASPVAADDRIILASLDGKVTVIKAGVEKPETLHTTDFGERISATPALVENKIYLRTKTKLYALGEK